jgi:hypothetical protein
VNDKVVITLAECYNKILLNLDLSKCAVSDKGILKVAYECSKLIDLRLKQTNVTAIAIAYLLNQCKDLKVIFIFCILIDIKLNSNSLSMFVCVASAAINIYPKQYCLFYSN